MNISIVSGRKFSELSPEELVGEFFLCEEYATILPNEEEELRKELFATQDYIEKILGFDPCAPAERTDGEDYVPVDVALSSYRGDTNWEEIPW